MTQNSVSTIASTPFCGLATQTYNVPSTGLYTVAATAFPPWQTSDQPSSVANPPLAEVQTITTVADSSGSLNSTWWKFFLAGNAPFLIGGTWYQFFYVWNNINSAGVDPAPAGGYGIQVAGATGVTANNLATAQRAAIAAAVPASGNTVTVSGATNAIILTNTQYGAETAAADGTAATGFGFSVGTTGTFGYTSGLVITVKHNTTIIAAYSQPAPTQAIMGGQTQSQATAGDTFTVITSSLSTADAGLNAVKGFVNVFFGPL
jgi:hypothetical protein